VGLRIGEQGHEGEQLDERAGPPMGKDERYPDLAPSRLMHEVDAHAIELRTELIERVELAFSGTPVEPVGPVGEYLSQVLEVDALLPNSARRRIGPARIADSRLEVDENLFLDPDREGLDAERCPRLAPRHSCERGDLNPHALSGTGS
jgi:hypothetical protein